MLNPAAQAPIENALIVTSGSVPKAYRAKKPMLRWATSRSRLPRIQLYGVPGEPIEDAEREETFRVNARVGEEAAVRGDPTARAPGGAFGPKLAQASEDRCRRPLEERLEPAVPETNRPERGVERKQPQPAPDPDDRRRQVARRRSDVSSPGRTSD